MLGLPSHSSRGADGQQGFPGQEVHLPPGVPQTVCSAVFFCEERSTYERLLYLKHLPTHAPPPGGDVTVVSWGFVAPPEQILGIQRSRG